MPIPEHVIEEVRDRADIVDVIGEAVELKKRGKNFVGLCPFHPEKTPSFNVTPDKQMYYCFGCQAGGNVFTFLMEHDKLEFPAAVRDLAERTGVEVPEEKGSSGPDPHAPLHQANGFAADFYHRRLLEAEDAAAARAYLEERDVARSGWETFRLGWAPEAWEALIEAAARHDIGPDALLDAGLAARSEKTGGIYDRFRGRLVFPIHSIAGKTIALSGRRLDDEGPKYLNSADSPVFTKGRTLFNLDRARGPIRREGAVLVVEGNFDVVAVHGAGFRNVVAPLGTAFTPEHARTLRRYTATAYLVYDGDASGERSAFKSADTLLAAGFAPRVVRLPEGEDPDSLIRGGGAAALEERIRESADVIDTKIEVVKERVDLGDVMRKRRAIDRLTASVARVPDPMTRSLYLDKIAAEFHVPRGALEVRTETPRDRSGRRQRERRVVAPAAPPRGRFAGSGVKLPESQDERYLLLHAISDIRWLDELLAGCRPEFFTVDAYADFFRRLARVRRARGEGALESLRASDDRAVHETLARVEMLREEGDASFVLSDRTFRESLRRIYDQALRRGTLTPPAQATGDVLVDTLHRLEIRREIARGRYEPVSSDGPEDASTERGEPDEV